MFKKGQIKSLHLSNFMCHDSLQLDLHHGTNFITGKNGAGKSAILTSLCIGLGTPSRFANRGSLDDLIKEGKLKATILIELSDTDARNSIFIRTVLSRNNKKNVAIKRNSSAFKKCSKRQLDMLLQDLNIAITNPCVLMNQDLSREFLKSETPRSKYKIFLKATMLDSVEKKIEETEEVVEQIVEKLRVTEGDIARLQALTDVSFKEYKRAETILNREKNIKTLSDKLLWVDIRDAEAIISAKVDAMKDLKTKHGEEEAKVNEFVERKVAKEERMRGLKEEIRELTKKIEDRIEVVKSAKNKEARMEEEKGQMQSMIRAAVQREEVYKSEMEGEQEKLKLAQSIAPKNTKKILQDLENAKKMFRDAKQRSEGAEGAYSEAVEKQNILEDLAKKSGLKCREDQNKINQLGRQLSSTKHTDAKEIMKFGTRTLRILDEIQSAVRGFNCRPIGPIGHYLVPKDQRWSRAVENCLGSNILTAYLVTDYHDHKLLREILNRNKQQYFGSNYARAPLVIVQKKNVNPYNVDARGVYGKTRVIDMLSFSTRSHLTESDLVWLKNAIIDQALVDVNYLVEDLDRANEFLMKVRKENNQIKRRVRQLFLPNGDRIYDRNNRSIAKFPSNIRYLLLSSKLNEQISEVEAEKAQYEAAFINHRREQSENEARLEKCRREMERLKSQKAQQLKSLREASKVLKEAEEAAGEVEFQVEDPSSSIRVIETKLEGIKEKIKSSRDSRAILSEKIDKIDSEKRKVRESFRGKCQP